MNPSTSPNLSQPPSTPSTSSTHSTPSTPLNPKVSIITVSFNSAQTIAETLRSVAYQSYANIEHIIVDGASTDQTMKIVAGFPVKRLGTPEEIASICCWIASDDGGYATGADFSLNGGLHTG
jgi:NAD(P)-dependent dehydrogenase (short-subunit alcohol dehydrogenase family)